MHATVHPVQRARALANTLRSSRRAAPTWSTPVDRDLARQAHDLAYLSQSTAPRVL